MTAINEKREEVIGIIQSLSAIMKDPTLTPAAINLEFHAQTGEQIPYRDLGYPTLCEFFRGSSKCFKVTYRDGKNFVTVIPKRTSAHVVSLVARQKTCRSSSRGRSRNFRQHLYNFRSRTSTSLSPEILRDVIMIVRQHPNGIFCDQIIDKIRSKHPMVLISSGDLENYIRNIQHEAYVENHYVFPINRSFSVPPTYRNRESGASEKEESTSSETKTSNFNAPRAGGDEDITEGSDDEFEFSCGGNYGKPMESEKKNDQREQSEEYYQEPRSNGKNYEDEAEEILIDDRTKIRLKQLIQNHQEGICCSKLPDVYFNEYKISLNYKDRGFNSILEFVAYLPEIFHCIKPKIGDDYIVYDATKPVPQENGSKETKNPPRETLASLYNVYDTGLVQEEQPLPVVLTPDTANHLIPEGAMRIGETVGVITVATYKPDDSLEVIVVEAYTPTFFFIHLRKAQHTFEKFSNQLQEFYERESERYKVHPVVLEKNLNIAVSFDGYWHRGIIKTVNPDGNVKVLLYDYGTVKTYYPFDVYYLHKTFSCLPMQAIPCGLYNVKPMSGNRWTVSITKAFLSKSESIPLMAYVVSTDVDSNSMLITLTDTRQEEDFHINDWLVEMNYATYGKMGDKVNLRESCLPEGTNEELTAERLRQLIATILVIPGFKAEQRNSLLREVQRIFGGIHISCTELEKKINKNFSELNINDENLKENNDCPVTTLRNVSTSKYRYENYIEILDVRCDDKNEANLVPDSENRTEQNEVHVQNSHDKNSFQTDFETVDPPLIPKRTISLKKDTDSLKKEFEKYLEESLFKKDEAAAAEATGNCHSNLDTTVPIERKANIEQQKVPKVNGFENHVKGTFINGEDFRPKETVTNKIVYESGPVMYNSYGKASEKKNTCNKKININIDSKSAFWERVSSKNENSENVVAENPEKFKYTFQEVAEKPPLVPDRPSTDKFNNNPFINNSYYPEELLGTSTTPHTDSLNSIPVTNFINGLSGSHNSFGSWIAKEPERMTNKNLMNGFSSDAEAHSFAFHSSTSSPGFSIGHERNQTNPFKSCSNFGRSNFVSMIEKNAPEINVVQISQTKIHVLIYENEGWLLTSEFINAFTTYTSIIQILSALYYTDINIPFKVIRREHFPFFFLHLDKSNLNVPRNSANKIEKIHLLPVKSMITILYKMKLITENDLKNYHERKYDIVGPVLKDTVGILSRTECYLKSTTQT